MVVSIASTTISTITVSIPSTTSITSTNFEVGASVDKQPSGEGTISCIYPLCMCIRSRRRRRSSSSSSLSSSRSSSSSSKRLNY